MRIHSVVDISQIIRYKEQVEGQKVKEVKLVEVDKIKEWEVKKY